MKRSVVLLLLAASLAGCGSGAKDDASGPVEIVWWHGQVENQAKVLEKLTADYNAAHPEVKVVAAFVLAQRHFIATMSFSGLKG